MKATELRPGLLVAVADDDGNMERAEVREVGGWTHGLAGRYDVSGKDHLVEFQTGTCRNQQRIVPSRHIKSPWVDYEPIWKNERALALRRETRIAMQDYNRSQAVEELEQVQAVLETLGIGSGLGSVVEKRDGVMQHNQAIFLTRENAALLLPHLKACSLETLIQS